MFKSFTNAEFVGGSIIKEGDTQTVIRVRLTDQDYQKVDLTGAAVTWSLASQFGRVIDPRPVTAISDNVVDIRFNENDPTGYGLRLLEITVTKDGTAQKYPSDSHLVLRVTQSNDNLASTPIRFASLHTVETALQAQFDELAANIPPGVGLQYAWDGYRLGVKREDETTFTYQELRGEQGIQGIEGPPGVQGKTGEGINILGAFDSSAELPASGNVGDAYLINTELWVWGGANWENTGTIQGPQGETGKNIEFSWNGYDLGIRQQGETVYVYNNLRGAQGLTGATGKSIEFSWTGTQLGVRQEGQADYIYSDLKGSKGDPGDVGADGTDLEFTWSGTSLGIRQQGTTEYTYVDLKGSKGDPGDAGMNGATAYEIAVANGFVGTEAEWLASLPGEDGLPGADGDTAYEVAVANGFVGTEADWLASLKGEKGDPGTSDGSTANVHYINVKDYSALVTDGTWTAAIVQALTDLPAGGTLVFPEGIYPAATFEVNKSCLITGTGTLQYNFDTATGAMIRVTAQDVTIEHLAFRAIGVVGPFDYKAYIHTVAMHTIVDSCRFYGGMQGVHFAAGATRGKAVNCVADNCTQSGFIVLGTSNCLIMGNTAYACGDGALSLFNAEYCIVTANAVHYSDQGITIDAGSIGNTITGNQVYGEAEGINSATGYYGIDLKNNSHSNTITGNTVRGCVVGISARYGDANEGGSLQAVSSNNVITGNTITECSDKGFATNPSGILFQAQYGLTIADNIISRVDGVQIRGFADGSYSSDVSIVNNLINLHGVNFGALPYMAIDYPAIQVSGFENTAIFDNVIQCAPETMTAALIVVTDGSFKAKGNHFDNVTYRVIEVLGAAAGQILDNSFVANNTAVTFAFLNSTGRVDVNDNQHQGSDLRYLVNGAATPFYAEGNYFLSSRLDAIAGTGIRRLLNNENIGSGITGGELRFNGNRLEMKIDGVWTDAGLKGDPGDTGDSAYEVAVANGFVGTESQWIASLKGEKGDQGAPGVLIIESRTSDPASPTVGQIWIRTDL